MVTFNISFEMGDDWHMEYEVQAGNPREAWEQVPDGAQYVDVIERLPSGIEINWNADGTIRETWTPGESGWMTW